MPPMKTQKKNVEASAYKELLAGVPEALEEALIWGNDWKQAFEWLQHGTNDIPNRVNNLYHVDRAGTNRKGRWVTLYTDRYEESDVQDLQRVAMMGMQGRVEECQAMGYVAGRTYDILVYRWLEHPQAETTKCYTLIHELHEHDFYIGETAITPSPVPNEPGPETFIEQTAGTSGQAQCAGKVHPGVDDAVPSAGTRAGTGPQRHVPRKREKRPRS